MKKLSYIILAVLMAAFCVVYIVISGQKYTMEIRSNHLNADENNIHIMADNGEKIVKCIEKKIEGDTLYLTFESVSEGKEFVRAEGVDEFSYCDMLYVHGSGVITANSYFGNCNGSTMLPIVISVYLIVLLFGFVKEHIKETRRNMYQYKNAGRMGLMIYLYFMLLTQILYIFNYNGLIEAIHSLQSTANRLSIIVFPLAFVLSVLVSVSNIQLLKNEGRNPKNLLGTALGLLICVGTVFPFALSEYLQHSDIIDVHNMRGTAMYVEKAVTGLIYTAVSYLECILIGMIIISIRAARHIPAYDKDYILILGCQINEDGTLTKLLQSRADRAVWFAKKQKAETGKSIIFVPSGGQGADEVISEGEAIENYLLSIGIEKDSIIAEKGSVNTYENMRNSMELINMQGEKEPKIAFSTTNYHVFRSGVIASEQGIQAEGIGSPTKRYFWINAFIREFIAVLYYGRKRHLGFIGLLSASVIGMVIIEYYSNQI